MTPINYGLGPVADIGAASGELWQYMGTESEGGVDILVTGEGGVVLERGHAWVDGPCHVFRHRSHPARGGQRVYIRVRARETRATDDAAWLAAQLAVLA